MASSARSSAAFQGFTRPPFGDAGREGDEDLLLLVHEERRTERALQPAQRLLRVGAGGGRQQDHELLAAEARQVVDRAKPLAHRGAQRLQGLVAGGVAQGVVELLEVVDVDQPHRQRGGRRPRARGGRSRC
jgi:hypothetical protein